MTRPASTIRPDAGVTEAARTLHTRHVKRLPVVTGPVASKAVALSLPDAVRQVGGVLAVEDRISYPRSRQ